MFISGIHISGFRNFSDLHLEGLGPATVIVGENGVGKSNLLYALRLVMDPSLPDSRRILRAEDVNEDCDTLTEGVEVRVSIDLQGLTATTTPRLRPNLTDV